MESLTKSDSFWSIPTPRESDRRILFKAGDKFGYLYAWAEFNLTMSFPDLDTAAFQKPLRWAKSKQDLTQVEDDLRVMAGAPSLRSLVEWYDRGYTASESDLTDVSSLADFGSLGDLVNIDNFIHDAPVISNTKTDAEGLLSVAYDKPEDEEKYKQYYHVEKHQDLEQTGKPVTYSLFCQSKVVTKSLASWRFTPSRPEPTVARRPEKSNSFLTRFGRFLRRRLSSRTI